MEINNADSSIWNLRYFYAKFELRSFIQAIFLWQHYIGELTEHKNTVKVTVYRVFVSKSFTKYIKTR